MSTSHRPEETVAGALDRGRASRPGSAPSPIDRRPMDPSFDLAPHLRALARFGPGHAIDADDAAQEAWLALADRIRHHRPEEDGRDFPAWSAIVVRNRLANLRRREARRAGVSLSREMADALIGREESPADVHERDRLRGAVRATIEEASGRLSEASHLAVTLRWIEGRTVPEIAEILGMSASQVRDRHRRALPILRLLLIRRFGSEWGDVGAARPDPRLPDAGEVRP